MPEYEIYINTSLTRQSFVEFVQKEFPDWNATDRGYDVFIVNSKHSSMIIDILKGGKDEFTERDKAEYEEHKAIIKYLGGPNISALLIEYIYLSNTYDDVAISTLIKKLESKWKILVEGSDNYQKIVAQTG